MSSIKGRVVAVAGTGEFYKIGKDLQNSYWYGKGNVDVSQLVKGNEIEFQYGTDQTGKRAITAIISSTPSPASTAPAATTQYPAKQQYGGYKKPFVPFEKKPYGKSADEQEAIKAQAVGHMVSRSLMVFNGQLDVNNLAVLENLIEKLYDKYYAIVQKHIDAKKTS